MNLIGKTIKGTKILVLGVAYKKDVSDVRESPALDVIGLLLDKGAQVEYHDPYVPLTEGEGWSLKSSSDALGAVKQADCVVLVTDHSDFDYQGIATVAKFIFDTRNAFRYRGIESSNIMRL